MDCLGPFLQGVGSLLAVTADWARTENTRPGNLAMVCRGAVQVDANGVSQDLADFLPHAAPISLLHEITS